VHSTAQIDETAVLGPNVVIGADCKIGAGVRIINSCVLSSTKINAHCYIKESIIGWKNNIGSWSRITGMSCTGEDCEIKPETLLDNVKILPHTGAVGEHRDKVIMC
jgi:mannose-1-phosphate guanylyltransferase